MSHEIRTPLNGVIGMLRLLEDAPGDAEAPARLATARGSAEHLLALSNDILDYASTENHRPEVQASHFALRDLVGQLGAFLGAAAEEKGLDFQLGAFLGATAEEKGLDFSVSLAPEAPLALYGDAPKIRQIVVNLLSNAVKTDRREPAVQRGEIHAGRAG